MGAFRRLRRALGPAVSASWGMGERLTRVELLRFQDCANYARAEVLLRAVLDERGLDEPIVHIEVPDEGTGKRLCFPGAPTIRIDGVDVEPGWEPCDECTPRCRLYLTEAG